MHQYDHGDDRLQAKTHGNSSPQSHEGRVPPDNGAPLRQAHHIALSKSRALQAPWDPERTTFRAKSVSKLVTATAVMQLAERGEVNLQAGVHTYFGGYRLPSTFAEPVTPAHLLTHTGGFADRGVMTNVRDAADLLPLGEYLARDRYPRVYPPGERISYGDRGPTMLAYLTEGVTGQPFPQYVREQIFTPLRMERSTFEQPAFVWSLAYLNLIGFHY